MDNIPSYALSLGKAAKQSSAVLAKTSTSHKNDALLAIADSLAKNKNDILSANGKDLKQAEANKLDSAMLDRLKLSVRGFEQMLQGLEQIAELTDPIGQITDLNLQPSGIQVGKMRVPLGVVAIIYESRPNVTIDAAALCLKSGNACILRGGSEAFHTIGAIGACITKGLEKVALPASAVQIVKSTDRAMVTELIQMSDYIDIVVPRGGKGLIELIEKEARVDVIRHLDGICHVYVDKDADAEKALMISVNSKTHRYGVCNAAETLLIHSELAAQVLPDIVRALEKEKVELRGCEQTLALMPHIKQATAQDWHTEYLAPVLSIKIVENLEEAIEHINYYGSGHTDAIVTENLTNARRFLSEVDSSSVMVNTSTRFADGFEYGLGAEIGISTNKIHVRGPVGLEGLTSQKWVVPGDGHIRS